jgi:Flp pilus assembly protein TadG
MLGIFKSMIKRFHREEEGGIAVEAVLVFPMLTWAYLATFVYFDAFRSQSTALKAAFTISDAISREGDDYITNDYITSLWHIQRFLTSSNHLPKLRVTVMSYDPDQEEYHVQWSVDKGSMGTLNDTALNTLSDQLPVMHATEVAILVQTEVVYEPVFSIGLEAFVFENLVVTRPRFYPSQMCYSSDGSDYYADC